MARKGRESLTEAPPPAASSSEDNDSDSDSDDTVSSSDDKSPINSINNNINNNSASSSDDDDDDEADDLTQPPQPPLKKPDPPVKPLVSDSDSDSDTDSDPKPPPSDHPKSKPTSVPVPSKRKITKADSSDKVSTPKKARKEKSDPSGSTPGPDEGSKKLFQRLWSEDDEIVILKGLIEFKVKKGKDPMSDIDGFLDFIKTSLHVVDVKKEQIVNKIRRLKGRFQTAKKRTLTNPHELQAFELSKSIWGGSDDGVGADENDNGMGAKSPSKSKSKASNVKSKSLKNVAVNGGVLIEVGKKVENMDEKIKSEEGIVTVAADGGVAMRVGTSHGIQPAELNKFGNVDEEFLIEGMKLLGDDERDALEKEWFNFNVEQMEGLVRRLELYQRTAKALLNAVKSTPR